MINVKSYIFWLPLFFFLSGQALGLPTAKYTVKVIDEAGQPIAGADANIIFMKANPGGVGGQTYFIEGKTDSEGLYVGEGETQQTGAYGARQDGYYYSRHDYNGLERVSGIIGFRRWQPWNPTVEVVLKKIVNPVSMYAKSTEWIDVPLLEEPVGFDLLKGDWVTPHGKGLTSDFIIHLNKNVVSLREFDASLTLSFSNSPDGIQPFFSEVNQGSTLRSLHQAPLDGYNTTLEQKKSQSPNQLTVSAYRSDTNYYFRTRCSDDDTNACLYGKIYGNIEFGGVTNNKTGKIKFTYYVNPTPGDTNIEFDPKKNKFQLPRGYELKKP